LQKTKIPVPQFFENFFKDRLAELKQQGNYREFQTLKRIVGRFPKAHSHTLNKEIIICCSNDYLGLGQNKKILNAIKESLFKMGAGAGGTRNISGSSEAIFKLEETLNRLHNKPASLVFSSGFVANATTLSTLGKNIPQVVLFSDEKNHASIIEGIKNSGAEKVIFKHNNINDLEEKLKLYPISQPKIIIFEAIYSMDGDFSKVKEIASLAKKYHALTFLDEVHSVGLYGKRGGGYAQELGLEDQIDIIQGTFGKAFGGVGGYISASKEIVDFVRSFASGFIFTTALPPHICSGALKAVEYVMENSWERDLLHKKVVKLKKLLHKNNLPLLASSEGHIMPLMVGDAKKTREISSKLLEDYGIYLQPINYPTVPKGLERLRLTITPLHSDEMLKHIVIALREVFQKYNLIENAA